MKEKITTKIEECFINAERFYNRTFDRPTQIVFKRNGATAGRCIMSHNFSKRVLEFQLDLAENNEQDTIYETVPHEVAHYIQFMVYGFKHNGVKPHGNEWQYIMRRVFGVEPSRTHNYDTSVTRVKKQTRHLYGCACGKEFHISTTTHNRIQKAYVESKRKYYGPDMQPYFKKPSYSRICLSCRTPIVLKELGNPLEQQLQALQKRLEAIEKK